MEEFKALTNVVRTARKDYVCNACEQMLDASLVVDDFSNADHAMAFINAGRDNYRILKGQKYRYCTGIFDGVFHTWRERIDCGEAWHWFCKLNVNPGPV